MNSSTNYKLKKFVTKCWKRWKVTSHSWHQVISKRHAYRYICHFIAWFTVVKFFYTKQHWQACAEYCNCWTVHLRNMPPHYPWNWKTTIKTFLISNLEERYSEHSKAICLAIIQTNVLLWWQNEIIIPILICMLHRLKSA